MIAAGIGLIIMAFAAGYFVAVATTGEIEKLFKEDEDE